MHTLTIYNEDKWMATEEVYNWAAERNEYLFHVYTVTCTTKNHDILKVRCLVTRMCYNEMHSYGFHQKFEYKVSMFNCLL